MTGPSTLLGLFLESVDRFPGNVALECDGELWTYADLAGLVERLASVLRRAGAGGATVALVASRDKLSYAGYLAILSAGSTVVPFSPAWPVARTMSVFKALGVRAVVGPDLETGVETLAAQKDFFSEKDCRPAYVLFTSGSTGRPKGVPIADRQAVAYVRHAGSLMEVGPSSRLSQMFDLTFDPSVFDLFSAWSAGATLCVPGPRERADAVGYVNSRGLTHWASVPSMISIAERRGLLSGERLPGLLHSQFLGEQLTLRNAALWRQAAPHSTIWNMYGPTELAVACAAYRLPAERGDWPVTHNRTVPIGGLFPGLESVLLQGELCVRGVQRFDGYLNGEDDEGRFVDGYYRTGDLVGWEDGRMVHLGRVDRQVKLGGHRVELGEIEAAIRSLDGVLDAVAFAAPTRTGITVAQAAYTGERVDPLVVAGHLRAALPSYMLPQRVSWMRELPLTANGKTDVAEVMRLAGNAMREG